MIKRTLMIVIAILLVFAITISAQDDTPETTPEAEVTAPPVITRDTPPDSSMFELVEFARGFSNPLFVTGAGDNSGRLFVVEQSGRIWILQDGTLLNTPFVNLSGTVSQDVLSGYSERGLLGLAFHPNFIENGLLYVNYTDRNGTTNVASFRVSTDDPNQVDLSSIQILMTIDQPYPNHNGGHMAFGPDGYLYISVGDGGLRDDPLGAGQNPSTLLGTLLRIDVDNPSEGLAYGIPADNPVSRDAMYAPEVWAFGLRNVWRFSFDRAIGDMYIADVGQDAYEEVNFQPSISIGGENYGWLAYEGLQRYLGPDPISFITPPIFVYSHGPGCSITGGYVYRGEAIPALQGVYFYSDFCSGRFWGGYRDETLAWQSLELSNLGISVSGFGEDDNGEIYIINYANGSILKMVPSTE